jgi:hypothetical protein
MRSTFSSWPAIDSGTAWTVQRAAELAHDLAYDLCVLTGDYRGHAHGDWMTTRRLWPCKCIGCHHAVWFLMLSTTL